MASRFSSGNYGGGGSSKENGHAKENGNSKDNVFDLDSAAFASDEFRMHEFKVKRCPRARPHDWTQCPFAHPGEKARRRDPRRYKYSGTACPEFRKSGCCRRGDACPFAHGVFECWLHPSRYRTQLCTDGTNCKRRVCFFAHVDSELRHPEDDPGVAQKQVQAELAAEVQTLQQQHLTQALQALLLQTTNATAPPERQPLQLPTLTFEMLKQNSDMPPTEMLTDSAADSGNSTAALQLVLLQQLAAKEQQVQQNMNGKSGDLHSSGAPESVMNGAVSNNTSMQHPSDAYDQLSQLKQLALSATTPVVSSTPAVGPSFDPSTLLSQLMPNGGCVNGADIHSHPLLINNLLNQNAMKMDGEANGQTRRSIDNSYLSSLLTDVSQQPFGSLGFPAPAFQNGAFMGGVPPNGVTNGTTVAPQGQPPIVSNGAYPAVSLPAPAPAMYSVENIQRLLQNPAFSSNLSQLFQTNPALLQQLTSDTIDHGNPSRHSIDNSYLTRLNGDVNRFVNNGGMQGIPAGDRTIPSQHDHMAINGLTNHTPPSNEADKVLNGTIGSETLLQELNALKLQLENSHAAAAATTLAGERQSVAESCPSMPPISSDSIAITSSGPSTAPQGQAENVN